MHLDTVSSLSFSVLVLFDSVMVVKMRGETGLLPVICGHTLYVCKYTGTVDLHVVYKSGMTNICLWFYVHMLVCGC